MRSLLSFTLLLLAACSTDPPPPPAASPTPSVTAAATVPASTPSSAGDPVPAARHSAKEGEMCGGIAGIRCAEGLTCTMKGPVYPDRAGTCTKGN